MNNKKTLECIIKEIGKVFSENPLMFLNEREIIIAFYNRLLQEFPEKITIESKTANKTSKAYRVHSEVKTNKLDKRERVDILVTKNNKGKIQLLEFNYAEGIPSTIFDSEDIIIAIELKFYRGFVKEEIKEITLRETEIKSLENDVKKLNKMKKANKNILTALLIFSHAPIMLQKKVEEKIRKAKKVDIRGKIDCEKGFYKYK